MLVLFILFHLWVHSRAKSNKQAYSFLFKWFYSYQFFPQKKPLAKIILFLAYFCGLSLLLPVLQREIHVYMYICLLSFLIFTQFIWNFFQVKHLCLRQWQLIILSSHFISNKHQSAVIHIDVTDSNHFLILPSKYILHQKNLCLCKINLDKLLAIIRDCWKIYVFVVRYFMSFQPASHWKCCLLCG